MKTFALIVYCLLPLACSTQAVHVFSTPTQTPTSHDPKIYRVGELEVRLYKDHAALERDLAAARVIDIKLAHARGFAIKGFFDRAKKRIYSLDDTRVLLHEFKHYLEPGWTHPIGESGLKAETPEPGCKTDDRYQKNLCGQIQNVGRN